jgi:hypothetical protein
MILLLVVPSPRAALLDVAIRPSARAARGDAQRADHKAFVGDELVVSVAPSGPLDLRVYRADGVLVARCPGPTCGADGRALTVALDAPGRYRVYLVTGMPEVPPGPLQPYLDAARRANAQIVVHAPIDVE